MSFNSAFAQRIFQQKYAHDLGGRPETWDEMADRVATNVIRAVPAKRYLIGEVREAISSKKFIPGGRYLYATGRPFHQTQNCLLLRAEDSREGWSEIMYKATLSLMTGAGIGIVYSGVRGERSKIKKTGGKSTGPLALMQMVNEAGRFIMQGGSRRSAIWGGLSWSHPDAMKLIHMKDWRQEVCELKAKDYGFPATLDGTNISILLDDAFFDAYHDDEHQKHQLAHMVYWAAVKQMMRTGEPGFSIDVGKNSGEDLRNACTEITSGDDSDICNLGSINMANVSHVDEMRHLVEIATAFLLAGTVYSDVPYPRVDQVRSKNRRLGLGLMGIHEWLLKHGKRYGPDDDLAEYLAVYAKSTDVAADFACQWDLSAPKASRAIAPTGTIGIVAETTTGIEPLFCAAYKRRYLKGTTFNYEYVVDPTAKRLVESGIKPESIEDAYTLAGDVERRLAFQAWVQAYVDHGISSTINLPAWGTQLNNQDRVVEFGEMLMRYLPNLRGITCYPDGARGGQPLTAVSYAEATGVEGEVFVEGGDVCDISGKGSCGA